jgi:nitroreductase
MLHELITHSRTIRRFKQAPISRETLLELVDLARLSPSGANRQPLKYFLSCDGVTNGKIFPYTAWAGYVQDWSGPPEGERPTAYIAVLLDTAISKDAGCDHGIAAQSIMLGAAEKGLGGCMIGSVKREGLSKALGLDQRYEILLVLALGEPLEKVVLEPLGADGSVKYFRTPDGVHHVPKRTLQEIVVQ